MNVNPLLLHTYYIDISVCTYRQDITFILDNSRSISRDWTTIKNFVERFIQSSSVSTNEIRIAIVTYDGSASIVVRLDNYRDSNELIQRLQSIQFTDRDGDQLASALRLTREQIYTGFNPDRPNVQNTVVIITDGQTTRNRFQEISEADQLKREDNCRIVVLHSGGQPDGQLYQIASNNQYLLTFNAFSLLVDRINDIASSVCTPISIPTPGEKRVFYHIGFVNR